MPSQFYRCARVRDFRFLSSLYCLRALFFFFAPPLILGHRFHPSLHLFQRPLRSIPDLSSVFWTLLPYSNSFFSCSIATAAVSSSAFLLVSFSRSSLHSFALILATYAMRPALFLAFLILSAWWAATLVFADAVSTPPQTVGAESGTAQTFVLGTH